VNAIKPPTAANSTNGIGNAARTLFTNPGLNNWDLAIFKDFQLGASNRAVCSSAGRPTTRSTTPSTQA